MPIRNPFRKTPGAEAVEYSPRDATDGELKDTGANPIDIPEPAEYKLCEINDSGVYLPPSPPESKRNFWLSKSSTSTTSSNHRSVITENEPFNISRESFDSYRRSFDISGRSPNPSSYDVATRQSLDSRRLPPPRSSFQASVPRHSLDRPNAPAEEGFEDVKLNEEGKPKKKGLFGFGSDEKPKALAEIDRPSSAHHFFGRKRGDSKSGAELRAMERPRSRQAQAVEGQKE